MNTAYNRASIFNQCGARLHVSRVVSVAPSVCSDCGRPCVRGRDTDARETRWSLGVRL